MPHGQPLEVVLALWGVASGRQAPSWRERDDGRIEVAAIDEGELRVWVVEQDGRLETVGQRAAAPARRWLVRLAIGGAVAFVVLVPLLGIGIGRGVIVVLVFGTAFVATAAVHLVDLATAHRQMWRRGGRRAWHPPMWLDEWRPASLEQLFAVQRLADDSYGIARVRPLDAWCAEVAVPGYVRTKRFVVDATGHIDTRVTVAAQPDARWHEVRTLDHDDGD